MTCFASSNKNGRFVYQLFKLVQLDASVGGMKHSKFLAFLKPRGQRGEGLILYLLKRNKAIFSMTAEEKEEMETRKKRLFYLLGLTLLFAIFLFNSVIVRL
jgi:hypothetical protein